MITNHKKRENGKKTPKIFLTVLLIILAVLLAFLLFALLFANHYLNKIERERDDEISIIPPEREDEYLTDEADDYDDQFPDDFDDETTYNFLESTDPDETSDGEETTADDPVITPEQDDLINILLIGQDSSSYKRRSRSDSMILISVNPKNGKMSMISFLRDTYVTIPGGYKSNRLNVPYVLGGFPLLYKTFEKNFGVKIDYGFAVNYDGFVKIIDRLGGIDIELTEKESSRISGTTAGENHLDGKKALQYARIRKIDSDFGRTKRQRKVIQNVYEKIKGSDITTLLGLMDEFLPYLKTDMTNAEMISLAFKLYPCLGNDIPSYSIPTTNTCKNKRVGNKAVLMPDLVAIRKLLNEDYLPY